MFRLGRETNTFTAIARCPRTGKLGIAVTTSEMATGGRVPTIKAHVGAVATQASTDPRLGPLGLHLLELGYPAHRVIAELEVSDPYIEHRQIGVVDRWGHTAVRTGANNRDWAGHFTGDGWITMGNYLVDEGVAAAMAQAMRDSVEEEVEERLVRAIEAGTAAGGQPNGQRSAAILVYEGDVYPLVTLRVDDHDTPMAELRRLFDAFRPLLPFYRERPDNPTIGSVHEWAAARGLR